MPKLPERAEIKQVINFIDALMLQLERASSEKPVERASTPPPAEALAEAPPTAPVRPLMATNEPSRAARVNVSHTQSG